jgi:hypothetical protein
VATARGAGFTDVRELEAWDATAVGDLAVTAAPGKHGVHEVTYVLQAGGRTVWFGGDTLSIPELEEIPTGSEHSTVALPHHFAFTSGRLGDRMITRWDNDPRHFADAAGTTRPGNHRLDAAARGEGAHPVNSYQGVWS